jgi:peptide-methionine (S)-S-oxide reductase
MQDNHEQIVLGGGCFWCTEAVFDLVEGVISATPGYAGGWSADPGYDEVCRGNTGHAEVVSVEYDPERVSLEELLDTFFASHDPTTLNKQGADIGTQYRSVILYTTDEQKATVEKFVDKLKADYSRPVVTEVGPLERFYPAEEHHQKYFEKNPGQGYCQVVVAPKVEKIRKKLGVGSDP